MLGVSFTITYEVLPEFELDEYKGLPATRIYHIVSEEEIQEEVDRIRENFMTTEPAEIVENENFVVTVVPTLADTAGIAVEGDLERPLQFEQLGLVTYDR